MPRDIPLGNGSLLVNFDRDYNLRDLYYPHIGQENHTQGHVNRVGIWASGRFAWLDDGSWERDLRYEHETLVSSATLHHPTLGISLHFTDVVDFDRPLFLRRITVTNEGVADEMRLFFHYDWHIEESEGANTVYYHPDLQSLVAYKNKRYFVCGGGVESRLSIDSWATGYKEFGGYQGTWRDAEDGTLSGNPIAQGSVDATLGISLGSIATGATGVAYHWVAAGYNFAMASEVHRLLVQRGPESFIQRTRNYWSLWVNKSGESMEALPQPIADLYKRSLLIMATQMDNDGAIIAATDGDIWASSRDSYAYMWPRDGSIVANALSHSGYGDSTRAFYNFCAQLITPEGYLLHKFTPVGALGSSWHPWVGTDGKPQLPIQEDETALVLYSLWQHYAIFRDVEFIKPLYARLVKNAANFMVAYRDPTTKLPAPSYDLWEERYGIHAFTIGCVYAGLTAAANFAEIFGEVDFAATYRSAAEEIKAATRIHLWDDQDKRFLRRITVAADGAITPDPVMDIAIAALFIGGMFPPDDPQMVQTMEALLRRLQVNTSVGGYARYEHDLYHQVSQDIEQVPGNPWFICSCWAAQYAIARAQSTKDLLAALPLMQWVVDHALPSGVLAEQVDPYTDAPLSASPLTWSHAEYVATVRWYVGKHRRLQMSEQTKKRLAGIPEDMAVGPGEPRRN